MCIRCRPFRVIRAANHTQPRRDTLIPPRRGPPPRTRPPPRRCNPRVRQRGQLRQRRHVRGILVLLVLGNEILHVGLGLGELHLVHTLLGVPMQERLALEHGGELVTDTLEELLDGSAVANEGRRHLEAAWWDGAERGLDVVWNPLNKERRVLVLDGQHLSCFKGITQK